MPIAQGLRLRAGFFYYGSSENGVLQRKNEAAEFWGRYMEANARALKSDKLGWQ
jgi:hypothetical protein